MHPPELYRHLVFQYARPVLLVIVILTVVFTWYSLEFELDASGESLVLENDSSLDYYRQIREIYGTDEFVVITYTPFSDLLSDDSLQGLTSIRDQLLQIENVEKVNSILDVPIIYNAGVRLSELGDELMTLSTPGADRELARTEFMTNPFYRELLVSSDGKTTALQVIFEFDQKHYDLLNKRKLLNELASQKRLTLSEAADLKQIDEDIREHNSESLRGWARDIDSIRQIMASEQGRASMHLGGVPMITSDMIQFIRHDLIVFGVGVLVFLLLLLTVFFRDYIWVLLPLLCCSVTAIFMLGFLGMTEWRITVISSNFISILLIITLSLTIHLIVRFRDLQLEHPEFTQRQIIDETVSSMVKPCFYTILTTIVAFASLVVSNIRPVIDFGWIMIIGLSAAFILSFILFPAVLSLAREIKAPASRDFTRSFTLWLAQRVRINPVAIIVSCVLVLVVTGFGMTHLKVENRFIDNFKSSTEIHQGMIVIDRQLGGTTPLEVIIDPDSQYLESLQASADEDDEFTNLFADLAEEQESPGYWLNPSMLETVDQIQGYLDENPIIGKVLSIGTVVSIAEHLNQGELDAFELAVINKRMPSELAEELVRPYLSDEGNQIRFSARVIESDPSLNRKQLLEDISEFMVDEAGLEPGQFHLTGMLVLYNNMLQSLFKSQILTLGAVLAAIFLTFLLLFRDMLLAVLGIVPNIFSAGMILGIMGWLRIPLDMMTITIASITIGIAVDDTIHYIHRFKHEYKMNQNHGELITRCHGSIGKAMFYTSVAIILGFAILTLSNFIPTINFGLMTGMAMLVALVGNLLLLPALVMLIKPTVKY